MTYSIAIRTLGTGGDNYRRLLRSITAQTVQPERVVVYIAEGYARRSQWDARSMCRCRKEWRRNGRSSIRK